jgi:Peptidase A4 family
MMWFRRAATLTLSVLAAAGVSVGTATASAPALSRRLVIPFGAGQSQNWSGYNQGSQALGGVLFHEVAGDWTVPTPSQHRAGEAEYSSDWIGIGGGCVDAACTIGDNTLIQTGTEQDVASNGKRTYTAWYELIPAPETLISSLIVHPGDRMHAEIAESIAGSNVWTIVLTDRTTGKTFKTTKPYSSSHLTAEWIQERPTLIGSSGTRLAPLPKLTNPAFDLGKVNRAAAGLKLSQQIRMTNASGVVIGRASAPDRDTDGFNACTYTTTCAAPTVS